MTDIITVLLANTIVSSCLIYIFKKYIDKIFDNRDKKNDKIKEISTNRIKKLNEHNHIMYKIDMVQFDIFFWLDRGLKNIDKDGEHFDAELYVLFEEARKLKKELKELQHLMYIYEMSEIEKNNNK